MDLWIRTQRRERLCKANNFVIREANKQGYYAIAENRNKNTVEYGIYKSKERALEVLDGIQERLINLQLVDLEEKGKARADVFDKRYLRCVFIMPEE